MGTQGKAFTTNVRKPFCKLLWWCKELHGELYGDIRMLDEGQKNLWTTCF